MIATTPAQHIEAPRAGSLGIGELPRLPADLVRLREMAGELQALALAEKHPNLAAYMSRASSRMFSRSERYVVLDGNAGRVLFGGRLWSDPQKAAEHAAHEFGADRISDDGYAVLANDWDEDGAFSVTLAEVVEVLP